MEKIFLRKVDCPNKIDKFSRILYNILIICVLCFLWSLESFPKQKFPTFFNFPICKFWVVWNYTFTLHSPQSSRLFYFCLWLHFRFLFPPGRMGCRAIREYLSAFSRAGKSNKYFVSVRHLPGNINATLAQPRYNANAYSVLQSLIPCHRAYLWFDCEFAPLCGMLLKYIDLMPMFHFIGTLFQFVLRRIGEETSML